MYELGKWLTVVVCNRVQLHIIVPDATMRRLLFNQCSSKHAVKRYWYYLLDTWYIYHRLWSHHKVRSPICDCLDYFRFTPLYTYRIELVNIEYPLYGLWSIILVVYISLLYFPICPINHRIHQQCEAPKIAKLVPITPITLVYGTYNYSYWGESKPTNITGGPHIEVNCG